MNLSRVKNWLETNGFDCDVAAHEDFCYSVSKNTIYCGTVADNSVIPFYRFAKSLGLSNDVSIEVIAFLHELGHSQCDKYMTSWQGLKDALGRKILMGTAPRTELSAQIRYFFYHRMYREKMATAWAINFIENNKEQTAILAEAV